MNIENITLPLFETEIDYLLEHKKKLEKKVFQYQVQRFIFEIESVYLKIKNLGSFNYEILPTRKEPHALITVCDSFYNRPDLLMDIKMYKNNGQEKDHNDDIKEMKFALRNIVANMEDTHSLNLFNNIKRKERFDVYNKIAEMYDMGGFKKVISLLKSEKPIYEIGLPQEKIKKEFFNFEINKEKFNFEIPEYAGSVEQMEKNFIFNETMMAGYKKLINEIERLVLYKLGFELKCYVNIYSDEPLPLIKCTYKKNKKEVIIGREVTIQGIAPDNEYYSIVKKCLDALQETTLFDFVCTKFNFGNEKNKIKQELEGIMAYKSTPSELEILKSIIDIAEKYSEIRKERIKIIENMTDIPLKTENKQRRL